MSTVGNNIKKYRALRGLSQVELADLIGETKQTVYKYERGIVTNIPLPKVEMLARALHCEPTDLTGWRESSPDAAPEPEIVPIYNALNQAGRKELCRYGRYLGSQEEYKQEEGNILSFGKIPHFFTAAAAGYVAPIEGQEFEMVERTPDTPAGTDFCIEVDGDSMEPYIHDGQRIYVKRDTTDLREFDVGVFVVDGDVLCKQWCKDYVGTLHLLSANPKREDANRMIPRSSGSSVFCLGKVLLPKRLPKPEYRRQL